MARSSRLLAIWVCALLCASGCSFFPTISRKPQYHNPFPQLSKVAVAPFFNHSAEPTVDGRQFALSYSTELQSVPGFDVVPLGRVEQAMHDYGITLANGAEVRRLAQLLEVDALVVGAVTDYTPYYPPRCGIQVEWYTANPYFHPIPAGYGLPWGTPDAEQIPPLLVFEAEMALAREQMKTQSPAYAPAMPPPSVSQPAAPTMQLPAAPSLPPAEGSAKQGGRAAPNLAKRESASNVEPKKPADKAAAAKEQKNTIRLVAAEEPVAEKQSATTATAATAAPTAPGLPSCWPDPSGFTPPPPQATRPVGIESLEPVLRHSKIYNGANSDVTEALSTYVYFRDDARFGGWKSYLQRSDDFIRFCCHMHIAEMLTARGGAGETRVVWRWPVSR
jgi:hypothetical protein